MPGPRSTIRTMQPPADRAGAHRHRQAAAVARRVLQQVGERALQLGGVGAHERQVGVDGELDRLARRPACVGRFAQRLVDRRPRPGSEPRSRPAAARGPAACRSAPTDVVAESAMSASTCSRSSPVTDAERSAPMPGRASRSPACAGRGRPSAAPRSSSRRCDAAPRSRRHRPAAARGSARPRATDSSTGTTRARDALLLGYAEGRRAGRATRCGASPSISGIAIAPLVGGDGSELHRGRARVEQLGQPP